MNGTNFPSSPPSGFVLNLHTLSIAAAGLGALLITLGFLIWFANNPNFVSETERRIATMNRELKSGSSRTSASDIAFYREAATENAHQYRACLLSSGLVCQQLGVGSVAIFNLAGILVLMAGGGLFFLSRRKTTA